MIDNKGSAARRVGYQRFLHEDGFSVDDRLRFLEWYLDRWNAILFELSDVANFTEDGTTSSPIDPVFAYEHQITVDRLFRKTLLAMSLDVATTANLSGFEIADLYDTLSTRLRNTPPNTEFFKRLFNTDTAPQRIAQAISTLPHPFDKYFSGISYRVHQKIEETVVKSIWRPSKVSSAGVLVRGRDLATETAISKSQFVAETMRAYRNGHHGYFTAGDPANRPSRFLFLVDGTLPVEMSALPPLWWLSYLADPTFVGWNHLPVSAYD